MILSSSLTTSSCFAFILLFLLSSCFRIWNPKACFSTEFEFDLESPKSTILKAILTSSISTPEGSVITQFQIMPHHEAPENIYIEYLRENWFGDMNENKKWVYVYNNPRAFERDFDVLNLIWCLQILGLKCCSWCWFNLLLTGSLQIATVYIYCFQSV